MTTNSLFTSESVSMGHPDKVCDQISDAILDAMIKDDPNSRVAVETMVGTGIVVVGGEVRTETYVDIPDIVRQTVERIGYNDAHMRFDHQSCAVLSHLNKQSPDIAMGVDEGSKGEEGAGDQGLMFGYACNQTPQRMPLPIQLAHQLVAKHAEVRQSQTIPDLRPDAKSQVTVEFEGRSPKHINTVVLSTQHGPSWNDKQPELKQQVIQHIIKPVLGDHFHDDIIFHVNPTGRFEIGGPHGDAGLTGRKIIVDTYGGWARHGGGAFSGKDPTKVDRSAAYMARYIAKNIVEAGLADECELQLSYAIGVPHPTSVFLECFGTEQEDPDKISAAIREVFTLTPRGIIDALGLRKPIYAHTAYHGHFGRQPQPNGSFSWEQTDKVDALKNLCSSTASV